MKNVHAMHRTPEIQEMKDIQLIHESIRFMRCIQSMCCTELMSCIKARRQHGLPVMHVMHGMHQIPWLAASLATLYNIFMLKKPQACGQFCQTTILCASCTKLQTAERVCVQASRITTWTTIQHVHMLAMNNELYTLNTHAECVQCWYVSRIFTIWTEIQ